MGISLLYIYVATEYDTNKHIVEFLKSKGITITLEPILVINKYDMDLKRFTDLYFHKLHKDKYDFILFAMHSTFYQLRKFQEAVKPRVGFIDIEHDLFASDSPEHCLNYGKSLIVTFQRRHYKRALKVFGNSRKVVNAKWVKLDIDYPAIDFNKVDKFNDAILIGTGIWNNITIDRNRDMFKPFNNLWYKKYDDNWSINNIRILPSNFTGPLGSKYCADVCKFFMTIGSSCYQDALLFESIPILMPANIVKQVPVDDILSMVTLRKWRSPGIKPFIALTTDSLMDKVTRLRNDPELLREVHKRLFLEWFDEDYYNLPSAHEVIYDFIKEQVL